MKKSFFFKSDVFRVTITWFSVNIFLFLRFQCTKICISLFTIVEVLHIFENSRSCPMRKLSQCAVIAKGFIKCFKTFYEIIMFSKWLEKSQCVKSIKVNFFSNSILFDVSSSVGFLLPGSVSFSDKSFFKFGIRGPIISGTIDSFLFLTC